MVCVVWVELKKDCINDLVIEEIKAVRKGEPISNNAFPNNPVNPLPYNGYLAMP